MDDAAERDGRGLDGAGPPRPIRVLPVGIGEMGRKLCRTLLEREDVEIVAACDHDPLLAGRDLGDVLGLERRLGLEVRASIEEVFRETDADVALLCTVTDVDELAPQVTAALAAGCDVISTSEPLSWPWRTFPEAAARLDAAARERGRSVLGTGVCPGFLPEVVPIVATLGCRAVDHVDIRIFGDVYPYGPTVWKGMGLGLSEEEYRRRLGGEVDIEFAEPLDQVAAALGLDVDEVREECEPLLAPHDIRVGALEVPSGAVCGFLQTTTGSRRGVEVIRLTVHGPLCSDLPPFWVEVRVSGEPTVKLRLDLEHEDGWATSSVVANVIPAVLEAPAGLIGMRDLRLHGARRGRRHS